jgi:hypothetical protein
MDVAEISIGSYRVLAAPANPPGIHSVYQAHAGLAEEFNLSSPHGAFCFFGISEGTCDWPQLVVSQRYEPAGYGFNPGLLIVPETGIVFIGAGTRVLAYALRPTPARLWIGAADTGFWGWARFENIVLMSAELELAAWTIEGQKLWTTFVEPPWSFTVSGEQVDLDVMGTKSRFSIVSGPRGG